MKTVNNKRVLMAFSALLIMVFHLWSMLTSSNIELFLVKSAYIGVDIFFFLSAYSLAKREIGDVKAFYISRFKSVYLKFALFALVMTVVSNWSIERLLKILCGIELFNKGGGSFLWFLPAIMIFYLVYPLIQKPVRNKPITSSVIIVLLWLVVGLTLTAFTSHRSLFIFLNRIPVIALGFVVAGYDQEIGEFLNQKRRLLIGLPLIAFGSILVYNFGLKVRLNVPIREMYYVVALPLAIGIMMVLDMVKETKLIKTLGLATLEAYGLQMVFGYKWAIAIYKASGSALITNALIIIILFVLAVLLNKSYSFLDKKIFG